MKKYSEVTEGIRIVSNIRPIILYGSQCEINFWYVIIPISIFLLIIVTIWFIQKLYLIYPFIR